MIWCDTISTTHTRTLIVLLGLFAIITAGLYLIPQIQARDIVVSEYMSVRSAATLEMMRVVTYLGNLGVVGTISVLVYLWLKIYHPVQVHEWAVIWSVIVTSVFAVIAKVLFARPRPELSLYQEFGSSYPSFHAAIAVGLYGYVIHLFAKKYHAYRYLIIGVGVMIIILIAISRVYLNVHYLSDIIAGAIVGGIGLTVAIATDQIAD